MTRYDTMKVTAYVEPELKAAFKRMAQDNGTTVATEVKVAMEQRLERVGWKLDR